MRHCVARGLFRRDNGEVKSVCIHGHMIHFVRPLMMLLNTPIICDPGSFRTPRAAIMSLPNLVRNAAVLPQRSSIPSNVSFSARGISQSHSLPSGCDLLFQWIHDSVAL